MAELKAWAYHKSREVDGQAWRLFTCTDIFDIAHTTTSASTNTQFKEDRLFDMDQFCVFITHLFVISILWVHFKNADSWREGLDEGNEKLNLNEFRLACRTLASAQCHPVKSDDQILSDFKLLDTNQDDYVDFKEVSYDLHSAQLWSCWFLYMVTSVIVVFRWHLTTTHSELLTFFSQYCIITFLFRAIRFVTTACISLTQHSVNNCSSEVT